MELTELVLNTDTIKYDKKEKRITIEILGFTFLGHYLPSEKVSDLLDDVYATLKDISIERERIYVWDVQSETRLAEDMKIKHMPIIEKELADILEREKEERLKEEEVQREKERKRRDKIERKEEKIMLKEERKYSPKKATSKKKKKAMKPGSMKMDMESILDEGIAEAGMEMDMGPMLDEKIPELYKEKQVEKEELPPPPASPAPTALPPVYPVKSPPAPPSPSPIRKKMEVPDDIPVPSPKFMEDEILDDEILLDDYSKVSGEARKDLPYDVEMEIEDIDDLVELTEPEVTETEKKFVERKVKVLNMGMQYYSVVMEEKNYLFYVFISEKELIIMDEVGKTVYRTTFEIEITIFITAK